MDKATQLFIDHLADSQKQVIQIIAALEDGNTSVIGIAKQFGVTRQYVYRIRDKYYPERVLANR